MTTNKEQTPSGLRDAACSASPEAIQYADYILNHYSRDSHADKLCLARDLERHGWRKSSFASLPWWRKDALGWTIETFKGKPVKSAIRILCQNIRKVICKPNAQAHPPTGDYNNQPNQEQ